MSDHELLSLLSRTFEIRGRREIGLKLFGPNLDTSLNSGFSLATLQDYGTADSEIESLMRSVMGLDSILEPSFRKMPDKPSMPAALLVSIFSIIFMIWLSCT